MGELRQRGNVWWIRYYRNGKRYEESARTTKKGEALKELQRREGKIADGVPMTSQIGRLRFEAAAADVVNDYRANGKKSLDEVERRIRLHLTPFFGGRRMVTITTADVRAYITHRQAARTVTSAAYERKRADGTIIPIPARTRDVAGVSAGEINRELTTLKRMFSLAVQAGKLLHKPHIPLLREDNTRTGFFEPEQYASVYRHLPADLQPVLEFAYITGWRLVSEVLPLEWRHVDLRGGEVRLDAGTTKNREGRVFPLTDDLRRLLTTLHTAHVARQKAGQMVPWVFVRMVADSRGGTKQPKRIVSITKAWKAACVQAGCPGRIPHDLRRSAIRNMVRRGVPERVAMKLSGHKTRSVFERYNVVSGGDLATAAAQLAGLTGTPDATGTNKGQSARFGGGVR